MKKKFHADKCVPLKVLIYLVLGSVAIIPWMIPMIWFSLGAIGWVK